MIVCWSVKGGSGTSVVAARLASFLAGGERSAVLIDVAGEQAAIFGVDSPDVGLWQWMEAGESVSLDSLFRVAVPIDESLQLVAPGHRRDARLASDACDRLQKAVASRTTVVDAGVITSPNDFRAGLLAGDVTSLLVVRPCYLAARRATACGLRPSGLVIVDEPGRALKGGDLADALGVPVLATVSWDPAVARLVDAGRIRSRTPRSLRPLDQLASRLTQNSGTRDGS